MRTVMNYRDPSGNIIRFIPARLTEGKKEWFVYFYAEDPLTGDLKRKRIKINRIRTIRERRRYGRELCEQINAKLRQGWSPWVDPIAPKGNTPLVEAMDIYLRRKKAEGLRPDSLKSYRSKCRQLREWLISKGRGSLVAANFSVYLAREFMDDLIDSGRGPNTYNNTITVGKALFNWLKDHQYVAIVPFDSIKKLKEGPKRRKVIPAEWRKRIYDYLEEHNRGFLYSCLFQFYGQLRPSEQIRMSIGDVDLEARLINVPAHAAKNGQERTVTIPEVLADRLRAMHWESFNSRAPLMGEQFTIGGKRWKHVKRWWNAWDKMRQAINLPREYQFYSLRDSGIVYLIECGVPINQVMRQAGHSDLSITSRYVKHANKKANPKIAGLMDGFN